MDSVVLCYYQLSRNLAAPQGWFSTKTNGGAAALKLNVVSAEAVSPTLCFGFRPTVLALDAIAQQPLLRFAHGMIHFVAKLLDSQ